MTPEIDRLLRSRRKTVAIIVERDGRLTVRAPLGLAESKIQKFVLSHTDWIARARENAARHPPPPKKKYLPGEEFLYLGVAYPLLVVPTQRTNLVLNPANFSISASALPRAEQVFTQWYRRQARLVLTQQVELMAQHHQFKVSKIRISSARTRWGSCSSQGTLSFTWRLVLAPLAVVDYVVIHELVHTRIHNHSKNFWAAVARLMPDYKTHLQWLKKNGPSLV